MTGILFQEFEVDLVLVVLLVCASLVKSIIQSCIPDNLLPASIAPLGRRFCRLRFLTFSPFFDTHDGTGDN